MDKKNAQASLAFFLSCTIYSWPKLTKAQLY